MFNVLPDIIKENIKNDYTIRRWFVILFAILFIQISFLIFLLPSWVLSTYEEKEIVAHANSQNVLSASQNKGIEIQSINNTNQKLSIINTTFSYTRVLPFVEKIISYKTNNITISQFTYESAATSTVKLTVRGVSSTRESLIQFTKNLQQSNFFQEVNSPVSNLVKDKNIDFTINLTGIRTD